MTTATAKPKLHERLRNLAEYVGLTFVVSLVVSGIVSGIITSHFESRLENNKQVVARLEEAKDKFDHSHNDLIAQIGIFANDIWAKRRASNKLKIQETIFNAQSQLIELKREMGDENDIAISAYQSELNVLMGELDGVTNPNDLGPIYEAVKSLLKAHDAIAVEVDAKAKVPAV